MSPTTIDKVSCRSAQIIAMGGGGFLMEPDNLSLDQYILDASGAAMPKVCFVGTASGDAQSFIDRFYAAFTTLHCSPTHISLFKPEPGDLREKVLGQDVIYVGGGNTRNMLALWREWEFDSYSPRGMGVWRSTGRDQRGVNLLVPAGFERFSKAYGIRTHSRVSAFYLAATARTMMANRIGDRRIRCLWRRETWRPGSLPTMERPFILSEQSQ